MIPFMGGHIIVSKSGVITKNRNGLGKSFQSLGRYLEDGPIEGVDETLEKPLPEIVQSSEDDPPTLDKPPRAIWVETQNVPATTIAGASRYMADHARASNARVQNPVYHFGVSLSPEEQLDRAQWRDVTQTMLKRLGLDEHQVLIVAHGDKDYQHVHIVANRVGPDGKVWKPRHDRRIQQAVAREMEVKYGLRRVPTLMDRRLEKLRELGIPIADPKVAPYLSSTLQERVAGLRTHDLNEATSWLELERKFAERLVFLEPAKRGTGLVITDGVETMNISAFHRSYSGPRLATRFGETYRDYLERTAPEAETDLTADLPDDPLRKRAAALLEELTDKNAVFDRNDVVYLARKDSEPRQLVDAVLAKPSVVELAKDRYTKLSTLKLEKQLLKSSDHIVARSVHKLPIDDVNRILAEKYSYLNPEQIAAVRDATTGQDFRMIVGHAGVGKTTLTNAIAESYQNAGYLVLGASPTGAAAERLQAETGLDSRTLASWAFQWGNQPMARKTILIVDEAGLSDTETTAQMLKTIEKAGAKVIPLGDDTQLTPVGAGNPFPVLKKRHGASEVTEIMRQHEQWQRDASMAMASGRIEDAIDAYRDRGHLHLAQTAPQAIDTMIEQHFAHRNLHPNESYVVLTHRRADVQEITRRIRDARKSIGELNDEIRFGKRAFAPGDMLRFRKNDHKGRFVENVRAHDDAVGVKNGTFGVITEMHKESIMVRLHSGRMVQFNPREYKDFVHGYAMTIHAAQGLTVDRASVYATPTLDRHLTNVAFTRHRKELNIYTDSENFSSLAAFRKRLARAPRVDMATAQTESPEAFHHNDREYLRESLENLYQSPQQASDTLDELLASSNNRTATYQELLETPSRLGDLNSDRDTEATARRHLRNAVALEQGSDGGGETPNVPSSEPLPSDVIAITTDKGAEKTIAQLSDSLSRWDRQENDLRRITEQRSQLPMDGDIRQLKQRLHTLTPLPADQAHIIYREPERAMRRFRAFKQQNGVASALTALRDEPSQFGDLRGMSVLNAEPRRHALAVVEGLTRGQRIQDATDLPQIYQSAKDLQERQKSLHQAMLRIGPSREAIVSDLRATSKHLPLRRAQDLVAPDHRRLLTMLSAQDARAAQSLNQLAKTMQRRRFNPSSNRHRLLKAMFRAHGFLRNPSLRMLRELTPANLRVVYTLRNLKMTARKLGILAQEQAQKDTL